MTEAQVTINGIWLTDDESMIVRLAVDALAGLLDQQVKDDGAPLTDTCMAAVERVRMLLVAEVTDEPSVN